MSGPTRRAFIGAGLGLAAAGAGCTFNTDYDHAGADAPAERPLPRRPRVAWVLGSGGPRGFVHVGVLKALDELGLAPDLIVGASVGALIGALRSAGLAGREIEAIALELSPTALARLAVGASEILNGAPLAAWVHERVGERMLEALPIRCACVAVRQDDGAVAAFTAGHAGVAVQASSAIEGRFTPVRIRGRRYVDPDWHRPMPVREARALGAWRVLAIDASAHEDRAPAGAARYREADLRKRALIREDALSANLVLHPDFGYWVNLSREFREHAIDAGYRATLARAGMLTAMHAA